MPVPPSECPACGAPDPRPWRRMPGAEPGDRATYLLVRCARCGTAATVGDPPAATHASGAYAPGPPPRGAALAAPVLAAFDRRRLRILRATVPPPGRLLDAGAGKGRFVAAARAAGYDASGIEPWPRAPAPDVERVAIEEFAPEEPYDAVSLWHVLEHLDDPATAIARIAGAEPSGDGPRSVRPPSAQPWLRPGGSVLVGVPNLASLQARLAGPAWYHLDLPRHRTHFTARGLQALVERHGMTVRAVHHVLAEHNPFGLWQSVVSRATPTHSWLYHALKRNAAPRPGDVLPTLAALPLAPAAMAVEAAAGAARRGGTIALLATAPGRRRAPGT